MPAVGDDGGEEALARGVEVLGGQRLDQRRRQHGRQGGKVRHALQVDRRILALRLEEKERSQNNVVNNLRIFITNDVKRIGWGIQMLHEAWHTLKAYHHVI